MNTFIGLDIGTTRIKAAAYDNSGREIKVADAPNPARNQPDGSLAVDPDELVLTALECLARLEEGLQPAAIAISTAMFSIFPVDRDTRPLAKSRTWVDTSPAHEPIPPEPADFYRLTGCRTHPVYPRVRLALSREGQPDLFHSACGWVSLAEYLFFKLTGKRAVSRSIASSTGLLDIHTLDWSPTALEWCGVGEERLSPLVDETFHAPIEAGPFTGVPLAIGATDGPLCQIGTDSLDKGQATSTVGSSGALRIPAKEPVLDELKRTWCYYLTEGLYVCGGAINSGGIVLEWLRDLLAKHPSAGEALRRTRPGAEGLVFLPTLAGERSPEWDPGMRGALFGLSLNHDAHHLMRSLIEGVTFRLLMIWEILHEVGDRPRRIRATGGYTKTREWLKLQSDLFGFPIELPGITEPAAFGAACLAAQAAGCSSFLEMARKVEVREVVAPDPSKSEDYRKVYERWLGFYELVKGREQ